MEEHKVLTGMLLVALVVSVVGTVITVDRLGGVNSANGLTGAAGGTGDLNITSDITITLPDSAIDFGNGKVDPSAGFASVSSAGDTADGTWANLTGNADNITVRNDGNVGVNITIKSNKQNGNHTTDSFICQSDAGGCGVGYESGGEANALMYNYVAANNEAGSCATGLLFGENSFNLKDTDYKLCGCLKTASTEDEVVIALKVGIPADAQGQKSATITFTSQQSDVAC
ncbi:hypothetical protein CL619_01875 [archaeon]|nr:hypothetical protein [archaeon]|tara:strand:+ start:1217 stop:1903 length:687 start_codon:yes stop_codon:yes gene_type:complete